MYDKQESKQVPRHFHVMIKPTGPLCNLDCTYCYYLSKKELYPDQKNWRMSDAVLDNIITQYIAAQNIEEINFSWQGGEPTLLGLTYFKKIVESQKRNCPPTKQIRNDLQTNGTLLTEDWCAFLRDNHFLVGLSVDGPAALHNTFRVDRAHAPTFEKVLAGVELLKKHHVEFNTLTVVNRINAKQPLEVYRFLRDELGARYLQFIPCVETRDYTRVAPQYWDSTRTPDFDSPAARPGAADSVVTDWSVDPEDYGNFLCAIFDEWIRNDVGTVFVPLFDCALGQWMGMPSSACYFAEICGKALAVEHDGSVYSCDHYVYPEYRLGNIAEQPLLHLVFSEPQTRFGLAKTDSLPEYCRQCDVRFACNGECPKNRFLLAPDGEPGLNYLCRGLRKFFRHIDPWMKQMARLLRAGKTADHVMKLVRQMENRSTQTVRPRIKLNASCPCGSGRKYKKCCFVQKIL